MSDLDLVAEAVGPQYVVERAIGAGGMATVYLADDRKHARRVAIKVLKPELAASLGVERFHREIRVAARLQHPHILPLLDSGESHGLLYFLMPYVDGESLRRRLQREGELPVHEAVRLLVEIVDALACAHAHGVVHRDIKPENILISGRHALVMDFGVAKAVSDATVPQTFTTAGVALGTPAYMSPEQATASPVDHRADIYAVGCLAYEILTLHVPFTGGTPQETLALHVTTPPQPLRRYRESVPPALEEVVLRCLAKRPADRWQTADELLHHLEQQLTPTGGLSPASPVPFWRSREMLAGAAVLVVAAAIATWATLSRPTVYEVGRQQSVTTDPGIEWDPALSPDGRTVAYSVGPPGALRIHVRQIGGQAIRVAPDSGPSQRRPLFSPDGTQLLYAQGENLVLAPTFAPSSGALRRIIATAPGAGISSAAWAHDGKRIAYVIGDSIYVRTLDGNDTRRVLVHHDADALSWSPDDRFIAFTAGNSQFANEKAPGNNAPSQIFAFDATAEEDGNDPVPVTDRGSLNVSPVWMPDGKHLLFISDRDGPRDVYAVAMRGRLRHGDVMRVTTGLSAFGLAVSSDGRQLLYSVLVTRSNIWEFPLLPARAATMADARQVTSGNQLIESVALAKDDRRLYFDSDRLGNEEVFRLTLPAGEPEQLTRDPGMDCCPSVSPDGRWVAFHAVRYGTRDIFVMPARGGAPQRVTSDTTQERHPLWSPDGTRLSFAVEGGGLYLVRHLPNDQWTAPTLVLPYAPGNTLAVWETPGRLLLPSDSVVASVELSSGRRTVAYVARGGATIEALQVIGSALYVQLLERDGTRSVNRVEHGVARRAAVFDDPELQPGRSRFATDGRHIFMVLGNDQADVQIADLTQR